MKNVRCNLFCRVFLAIVVLCTACSKKETPENRPLGKLDLNVGISVATHDVYNPIKAAEPDEFQVTIYSQTGIVIVDYDHAAELPETIDLEEGSYYVVASSNNSLAAAFDNDYYRGQSEVFQVQGGETTTVTLTCVLANIMVSVIYEQNVINDFDTYSTSVSNTGGSLVFGMAETRAGYFNQGPLQIEAVLGYTDGSGSLQSVILTGSIAQPEAGKHYEIHIDASLNQGSAILNLHVNETFETEIISLHQGIGWGDLLISEIMFNPLALGDTEGEWIEVFNNSGESINMINLAIRRGSNNAYHVISSDLILASGEYAVLGRTATATNNVDYVYGTSISLANAGENLIINTYGTNGIDGDIICSVDYGAEGFNTSVNGKSLQLNAGVINADAALLSTNWCSSTLAYNTGDFGTPGFANTPCQ
jgi:hypothetical protein